jgi:hypothetical protein
MPQEPWDNRRMIRIAYERRDENREGAMETASVESVQVRN